ncbi:hypothetical protein MES5069_1490001 [Mesorhizobium escarrei]|uniref:Uncharacterized protein n=1 Tax=Mesorhizobium escarrei TaxID=666018 RepID=A0ABN8JHJ3_9HYPH|nr:hypothetical protein MES5069_1490001 [Mesorhizobium escarrei]
MTAQLLGRWAIRSVQYRLFVTTGIIGGFATFSAFLTECSAAALAGGRNVPLDTGLFRRMRDNAPISL